MDADRRWGLSLASLMFLMSALVQCQNQTSQTTESNSSSTLDEIVPGSLKIGTGNVFEAPDLFGGEPFSLRTDPVTGEVDFQTRTVDVQTVNEAREQEEAKKVAELREDLQSRVPSSQDLPLEGREEEYVDIWGQPVKRADFQYYDEEGPEAREPIMAPPKGYTNRPPTTTPKEEESFMSIFESLFGGGEEEKKPEVKPTPPPYRQPYPAPHKFTTESTRTSIRHPESSTHPSVYQQHPDRYSNYQQPPERHRPPPERFDPYKQVTRPDYQQQRVPQRRKPVTPERPNLPPPKPVHEYVEDENLNSHITKPKEPENIYQQQLFQPTSNRPTSENVQIHEVTPERITSSPKPVTQTPKPEEIKPKTTTTTTTAAPSKRPQNEWSPEEDANPETKKENINRQDTFLNEVTPKSPSNQPDYFNFINLPVHYSTKDTAIPLISTSYANTKVQGMGASKYEKNNGKYSNHKYEPAERTTKKPNNWPTRRPTTRQPAHTAATRKPSFNKPVDFTSLEYDEAAIGAGADFGGYGHKEGVKVETVATQPPTRATPTRTTFSSTTLAATTTSKTTTTTTTRRTTPQPTRSPAIVKEYDEYDYEPYPAQVKPIQNPSTTTTKRPTDVIAEETRTTINYQRPKETPKPIEPEYEYYDYDTEAPAPQQVYTTTTTTTTTTAKPTTTTTQKYKIRYPSLSKDRIKRPEEKVEVVVPTKIETTSPTTTTSSRVPNTSSNYFQRPTTQNRPAPVYEEEEENLLSRPTTESEAKPIIVTANKKEPENVNIVMVPTKNTTETIVTARQPEAPVTWHPDYTTEFTVGVVHGHGHAPSHSGYNPNQGQYIASSIAASPFDGPDEPFRPIARPAGMSASFQVVGDDDLIDPTPEKPLQHFQPPSESDIHEPHEFIPSPQFHRPDSNHFLIGASFNAKPANKPSNSNYYQPPPAKNEVLPRPKPQRPIYTPPPSGATDYFNLEEKPAKETPNLIESNRPYFPSKPVTEVNYYKPTQKPVKEEEEDDYGFFDVKDKNPTNVELAVDYDFDGIQTEPKPGQYVIFPKPQLNSEINENQVKKIPNTPIPHYHEKPVTEPTRPVEVQTTTVKQIERPTEEAEKQEEVASHYPRPHWEKNQKPSFLINSSGNRSPLLPPQMSQNLIPPGNLPTRFRKPVAPSSLPPVRKNYNEGNFQLKPKPNLPNILPQFRPNAKIGNPQRPYRPLPPNRRKENFPYRIQNEPDAFMHRDFEVKEEIIPKFITNRVRLPEYDQMMIQKRSGVPPPPPSPRRVQRTPVTTLQMLQQNHGHKKQNVPSTREDQADPLAPLVPPSYKNYKEEKKDVYVVYPVKTPFNSNIKIEDPDKIDYNFNQTFDQVPLLKPSKKKDKKPDFPYGFVTPEGKTKVQRKEVKEPSKEVRPNLQDYEPNGGKPSEVRPNIQDYMPSGLKVPQEKHERIDMNLHMQSNNQWNQVSAPEVLTYDKEDETKKLIPPTQYHTLLKNTNASEFTLGAVMHTLPEQNRKGSVTSVNLNEGNPSLIRPPGLNVNERIANGKIVTVSMPLDVKEEKEATGFQAPFQASSNAHTSQGWNILEHPEGISPTPENVTQQTNGTFNFENFTPQLIGGFKPIYNSPDDEN